MTHNRDLVLFDAKPTQQNSVMGRSRSQKTFVAATFKRFFWPRNPVKVLFIPITEAQVDELMWLAEQGAFGIDGFLGW